MKLIPEDDGTLVDYSCLLSMHEHAEANVHKNNGLVAIRARHPKTYYSKSCFISDDWRQTVLVETGSKK
jgi:hypothetical protein